MTYPLHGYHQSADGLPFFTTHPLSVLVGQSNTLTKLKYRKAITKAKTKKPFSHGKNNRGSGHPTPLSWYTQVQQLSAQFPKQLSLQRLGKDICYHVFCRHILNTYLTRLYPVLYEEVPDVYMSGTRRC